MIEYTIHCDKITDKGSCHNYLSSVLSLPEYYGNNLDSLYDCLTDMPECSIELLSASSLSSLGKYGRGLLSTFVDASLENRRITLIIS